jgi:NifU-like protein involved in Fe-S cluster formation
MNGLDSLYQELILDHSKHPRGSGLGPEEGRTASSHQHNPMCGDDITLRAHVDDSGEHLLDVTWEGSGPKRVAPRARTSTTRCAATTSRCARTSTTAASTCST